MKTPPKKNKTSKHQLTDIKKEKRNMRLNLINNKAPP